MITFTPIHESDGDKLHAEFFRPEFIAQRLGTLGEWRGEAKACLHLLNPVQSPAFENLLHGRSPEGQRPLSLTSEHGMEELGWRFTLSTPRTVSVLWAMAPGPVRAAIELAHDQGIGASLWHRESSLCGGAGTSSQDLSHGALFATFRGGTDYGQSPHLHTSVFLFNLKFRADGKVEKLSPDRVRDEVSNLRFIQAVYTGAHLLKYTGLPQEMLGDDIRLTGVPSEIVYRFFFDRRFSLDRGCPGNGTAQPLPSQGLFRAWQEKGQEWGWGPREVDYLLTA